MADVEESIYNLIPRQEVQQAKPPMYRSKYPGDVPPTASTFGRSVKGQLTASNYAGELELPSARATAATWGPSAKLGITNAKKSAKPKELRAPKKFNYGETQRKPAVPKAEAKKAAPKAEKNFITENAIQVIVAGEGGANSPRKRATKTEVAYVNKPDYGKVPEYLSSVKDAIKEEKAVVQRILDDEQRAEEARQPHMRELSEEERTELLAKLKEQWNSVNSRYQSMTHMVTLDTVGKVKRKEEYERQLQTLEKSIEKLSKRHVFIHDE